METKQTDSKSQIMEQSENLLDFLTTEMKVEINLSITASLIGATQDPNP